MTTKHGPRFPSETDLIVHSNRPSFKTRPHDNSTKTSMSALYSHLRYLVSKIAAQSGGHTDQPILPNSKTHRSSRHLRQFPATGVLCNILKVSMPLKLTNSCLHPRDRVAASALRQTKTQTYSINVRVVH